MNLIMKICLTFIALFILNSKLLSAQDGSGPKQFITDKYKTALESDKAKDKLMLERDRKIQIGDIEDLIGGNKGDKFVAAPSTWYADKVKRELQRDMRQSQRDQIYRGYDIQDLIKQFGKVDSYIDHIDKISSDDSTKIKVVADIIYFVPSKKQSGKDKVKDKKKEIKKLSYAEVVDPKREREIVNYLKTQYLKDNGVKNREKMNNNQVINKAISIFRASVKKEAEAGENKSHQVGVNQLSPQNQAHQVDINQSSPQNQAFQGDVSTTIVRPKKTTPVVSGSDNKIPPLVSPNPKKSKDIKQNVPLKETPGPVSVGVDNSSIAIQAGNSSNNSVTSGSQTDNKPAVASSGSQTDNKPAVASSGSQTDNKPAVASSGSQTDNKPAVASSGSQTDNKPAVASSGSQTDNKPAVASSGSQVVSDGLKAVGDKLSTVDPGLSSEKSTGVQVDTTKKASTKSTGDKDQNAGKKDASVGTEERPVKADKALNNWKKLIQKMKSKDISDLPKNVDSDFLAHLIAFVKVAHKMKEPTIIDGKIVDLADIAKVSSEEDNDILDSDSSSPPATVSGGELSIDDVDYMLTVIDKALDELTSHLTAKEGNCLSVSSPVSTSIEIINTSDSFGKDDEKNSEIIKETIAAKEVIEASHGTDKKKPVGRSPAITGKPEVAVEGTSSKEKDIYMGGLYSAQDLYSIQGIDFDEVVPVSVGDGVNLPGFVLPSVLSNSFNEATGSLDRGKVIEELRKQDLSAAQVSAFMEEFDLILE